MPVFEVIDSNNLSTMVVADHIGQALSAIEDIDTWDDEDLPIQIKAVPWDQPIAVHYGLEKPTPGRTPDGSVWNEDEGTLTAPAGEWDEHYRQPCSICSERWPI
jgi:hypothetical protein